MATLPRRLRRKPAVTQVFTLVHIVGKIGFAGRSFYCQAKLWRKANVIKGKIKGIIVVGNMALILIS